MTTVNPSSNLVNGEFAEFVAARLLVHHAVIADEVLKKKAFEYTFRDACRRIGKQADLNTNSVMASADLTVDGERFSLKTEASQGMPDDSTTISKLMEARWIRECKITAHFASSTKRVAKHLREYDRMLLLRGRNISEAKFDYKLFEIPLDLLLRVERIKPEDISDISKNGSASAKVFYKKEAAFTLAWDGSVEKITVRKILLSNCIFHAGWEIPIGVLQ